MDEWEFLRRPVRAKPTDKELLEVVVTVIFGGTDKEFVLSENSTFETVYGDYEDRFANEFLLTHGATVISKYTKVKSLVPEMTTAPPAALTLTMQLKPASGPAAPSQSAAVYTVRYNQYLAIEVKRTDETTIDDLHRTIIAQLPQKENKTVTNTFLSFDGDTLEPTDKIDPLLIDQDLIDLMDRPAH